MKFTTKIEVSKYLSGEFLTCLICYEQFKALGTHLCKIHDGMTVDEYKIIFGLPHSQGLVAGKTRELMANNLVHRIQSGEWQLTMSPATLAKAQHAPKKKSVHYNKIRVVAMALQQSQKRKANSLVRINAIDWDDYLDTVSQTGRAATFLCTIPGMPSYYDVRRKKEMDPNFKKKYDGFTKYSSPKYKYPAKVMQLKANGMTIAAIADCLNLGETTIIRILHPRSRHAIRLQH